jgi:Putative zinc-finger domain
MSSFRFEVDSLRFAVSTSQVDRHFVVVDPAERTGLVAARQRLVQSRAITARARLAAKPKLSSEISVPDISTEATLFSRDARLCMETESELTRVLACIESLDKKRSDVFNLRRGFQDTAKAIISKLSELQSSRETHALQSESTYPRGTTCMDDERLLAVPKPPKQASHNDTEGVICMWDLMGECADPDCRFAHTSK